MSDIDRKRAQVALDEIHEKEVAKIACDEEYEKQQSREMDDYIDALAYKKDEINPGSMYKSADKAVIILIAAEIIRKKKEILKETAEWMDKPGAWRRTPFPNILKANMEIDGLRNKIKQLTH